MPNAKLTAPPNPARAAKAAAEAAKARGKALHAKGNKRTPAEAAQLLDDLVARVEALEAGATP